VNAYVGAQLLFVMGSTSADGINGNGFDSDSKLETSTTSIGAGLLLGVEWFPWENVSFGAEYALGFLSGSGETESTVNGTGSTSDSPSTMSIGTSAVNGANLTLSVFF
jgi:opacity protein-like surface antigen